MTTPMQNIDEVAGQGVYFSTDHIGVLERFAPIEDADVEVTQ